MYDDFDPEFNESDKKMWKLTFQATQQVFRSDTDWMLTILESIRG